MVDRAAHIDGLRAAAVLLVIAFHAFPWLVPGGYIGVDVFFVISGYLISGIIIESLKDKTFSFLRFYSRRIRRIFPALVIIIASVLALGWLTLLPADYEALAKETVAGVMFIPNFLFWSEAGYFDKSAALKPLLHLWSLGVEEQFYIVWPFLLFGLAGWNRTIGSVTLAILTFGSFAYGFHLVGVDPVAAFYSPLSRLWEISLGALLAIVAIPRSSRFPAIGPSAISVFAIATIVAPAFLLRPDRNFPGLLAAIPTAGTAALIWSGQSAMVNRVLALRPLVYIGLISYPLYLWHWPLLSIAEILGISGLTMKLAIVAASFLLAAATYELIEKPARTLALRTASVSFFAAMAVAGILGTSVYATGGVYARYPKEIASVLMTRRDQFLANARLYSCWLVDEKEPLDFAPECFRSKILIWGDSHAAHLYPGLASILPDIPIGQLTRSSCPPIQMPDRSDKCRASNELVFRFVAKSHPRLIIIFAAWAGYYTNWPPDSPQSEALAATLNRLRSLNVPDVLVIGPAPVWKPDLPVLAYKVWAATGTVPLRHRGFDPAVSAVASAVDRQLREIATAGRTEYISLVELLCNDAGCLVHEPGSPGTLFSWDYGHLTTAGARFVAQSLQLDKLLNESSVVKTSR